MGRPAKTTETEVIKSENANPQLDMDAIIKEAVKNALASARAEWEKESAPKVVEKKPEAVVEPEEDLPDTLKIEVISNVVGKFFLKDREENPTVNTIFGDRGDKYRFTLAEVSSIKRNKPHILNSGMLCLSRVIADPKNKKIKQVYEELGLTRVYSDTAPVTPLTVDDIFDPSVSFNDFSTAVRYNMDLYDTLLEIAYDRYRKGSFSDNGKMNVFRELSKNENLFR